METVLIQIHLYAYLIDKLNFQFQFKGLGEDFNFQCATTTNQSRIDIGVVDSCNIAGSHLWFCGYEGFGADVSARKESRVTIFSYHDGRHTHVNVSIFIF